MSSTRKIILQPAKSKNLAGILILSIVLVSCSNNSSQNTIIKKDAVTAINRVDAISKDSLLLEKAMDSIFGLPRVKAMAQQLEKEAKSERRFSIIIAETPSHSRPYYWLKAGENDPGHFVTIYHFYVYPHPLRIVNYNTIDDKEMSLDEWQKKLD